MAIRHVSEFEHIQTRPGHYIRDTTTPFYLLTEVIDNAADELLSKKADTIIVTLNYKDGVYSVIDNGRGIPIRQEGLTYDVPIEICTDLRTGGKFDNDLYDQKSGLHGEGLTIVNALSEYLNITVKDKRSHKEYIFYNSPSKDVVPNKVKGLSYSTKVEFKPDSKYFDTVEISKEDVIERLKCILVTANNEKVNVLLKVIDKSGNESNVDIDNDIITNFNKKSDKDTYTGIIKGKRITPEGKEIIDEVTLYINRSETTQFSYSSIVNTLPMTTAGADRVFIRKAFNDYLFGKAKDRYVSEDDMVAGVNVLLIAKLSDPSFSGQQKYSLVGGRGKYDYIFNQANIDKLLDKFPTFVTDQIDYAESVKMQKDSKNLGKGKKGNKVNVENLRDCTSKKLEERELYIVEGNSAGGTLLQARDVTKHAVLPLRGKILNVLNSSFDKIVDSKTLGAIFNSIGIKPNNPDLNELRYGKVVCLSDSDVDGLHIAALLVSFFGKFASELIKNGNLYIGVMPLFGTYEKKKFIPIFDDDTYNEYRKKGANISRYKGLGEMSPEELYECAFDENTRHLIQVTPSNIEDIEHIWENKQEIVKDYIK